MSYPPYPQGPGNAPGAQPHPHAHSHPKPRRRGRFGRFVRGYLMLVGALTTLYVLVQLLVRLLIEIGKWMPLS